MAQTGSSSGGQTDRLRRNALGVAAITFFVVSAAAPLTAVAGGYPIAMLFGNGSGVPAAVVLTTLLLLIFSVGYTTMARHISNAGSFFAFTARGLGGVAGGGAAYIAVLAYNAMQIGLYGLFGAVTAQVLSGLPGIGPVVAGIPWWGWALLGMALVGAFGYLKIDLSARVLAVLVCVEYIIVLILDFAIIGAGGDSGNSMVSFTPEAFFQGSPTIGLLLCFAAFMGFEATTIYSEEARDSGRTVPRATYLSVLIIGIFYAVTTWCMVNGEGADKVLPTLQGLPDPAAFMFILSERYIGAWHSQIMGLLLISSVFAALLAFHNAAARYFYVLGREGLLPAHLGQTHDAHQSPHLGSLLQTVLAFIVLGIFIVTGQDPFLAVFAWLTNLATLSVITLMALVSFAVIAFFRKRPELSPSGFKTFLAPLVAGVLLAIIAILVVKNFPILTGANDAIAYGLVALVPIAGLLGAVVANQLKQKSGAVFAELGAHRAD
ncbi:APC family permease [Dongia sedimenti]|uniref:APC family permease n=1 Tax=Dongia sedimenti TaxID=3064282 RepID=A0ABU0YU57_9PROT|nr:APC family permease [Rhodospirillaceae bacterium R-7]